LRRLAALLLVAACAPLPEGQSDWERRHLSPARAEQTAPLPPYPAAASLLEFAVPEGGGFRFFVDARSLAVGEDGVVRYVLVARSPSNVDNASFEGLRCATGEYRIYATGHADGTWAARAGQWQPVSATRGGPWRQVLQKEYFCDGGQPIRDRDEALRALRLGGRSES
jgi:hypothetical protein